MNAAALFYATKAYSDSQTWKKSPKMTIEVAMAFSVIDVNPDCKLSDLRLVDPLKLVFKWFILHIIWYTDV